MLNGILVSPDPDTFKVLQRAAIRSENLTLSYSFDRYPAAGELLRMIENLEAHVVMLDISDVQLAGSLLDTLRECSPDTSVIGAHGNQSTLLPGNGVAAFLPVPCTKVEFEEALQIVSEGQRVACPHLWAFLPAKAGSGSSTIALNTGATLAEYKRRVLLLEADLRSGAISIALNHALSCSIQRVLTSESVNALDWGDCIVSRGRMDMLLSNRSCPKDLPSREAYGRILEFVIPRYEAIVVDLPELVNNGTSELVVRAQSVFVVCTQEVLSLKLAERRFEELTAFGVSEDRIKVVVNRWQSGELPREDVARILKRSVSAIFPNDYRSVRHAIINGDTVASESALGSSFHQFAAQLVNEPNRKASVKQWPMARMIKFLVRSQAAQPA